MKREQGKAVPHGGQCLGWPTPTGPGQQDWIVLPKRTKDAYICAQLETQILTYGKQVK